jgi:hypothetical protein
VNNTFHFALLSFILCPLMALPAFGRREGRNTQVQEERIIELPSVNVQSTPEQNDEQDSVVVQVSGRVRLVGTSLFPELVISGPDMEWYIDGDEAYKLTDLQHRTVTVKGTETILQLTWASGRPAGERRMLNNIVIIDVE